MNLLLPIFLRVRIGRAASRWPALWLPVFVVWPLVWSSLLIVFVVALASSAAFGGRAASRALALTRGLYALLVSARGTRCEVRGHDRVVELALI